MRKRIGVMVPSTNTTCEADYQLAAPRGLTIHGQRLWLTNDALGEEGMNRMNAEIESGARYLATDTSAAPHRLASDLNAHGQPH